MGGSVGSFFGTNPQTVQSSQNQNIGYGSVSAQDAAYQQQQDYSRNQQQSYSNWQQQQAQQQQEQQTRANELALALGSGVLPNALQIGEGGVFPGMQIAPFNQAQIGTLQALAGTGLGMGEMVPQAMQFLGQGANIMGGAAAPISAQDVQGFYNPMAENITQQMQREFARQDLSNRVGNVANTGGVGAERSAVSGALLAGEQARQAGGIYAGLYDQALRAAQQQKAQQLAAGQGIGGLAPIGLQGGLGGLQTALQATTLPQQLQQAGLQAQYQQQLGQYQDPFMRLAAQTGVLGPLTGLGQTGTATTTGLTTNQGLGSMSGADWGTANTSGTGSQLGTNVGYQAGVTGTGTTYPGTSPVGAITGLGTTALGGLKGMFSDRRAKTDIQRAGKDPRTGLPLYAFRYKGDPKSYPKVVGPMAQDVAKKYPEAVRKHGGSISINPYAADRGLENGPMFYKAGKWRQPIRGEEKPTGYQQGGEVSAGPNSSDIAAAINAALKNAPAANAPTNTPTPTANQTYTPPAALSSPAASFLGLTADRMGLGDDFRNSLNRWLYASAVEKMGGIPDWLAAMRNAAGFQTPPYGTTPAPAPATPPVTETPGAPTPPVTPPATPPAAAAGDDWWNQPLQPWQGTPWGGPQNFPITPYLPPAAGNFAQPLNQQSTLALANQTGNSGRGFQQGGAVDEEEFGGEAAPIGLTNEPMDEDEDEDAALPEAATSTQGAGSPFQQQSSSNPWQALMQAGLGMMAAAGKRDARGLPTAPAAAIGQGGLLGMQEMARQQKMGEATRARSNLEAHRNAVLAETARRNRALEARPFVIGQTSDEFGNRVNQYGVPDGKGGYRIVSPAEAVGTGNVPRIDVDKTSAVPQNKEEEEIATVAQAQAKSSDGIKTPLNPRARKLIEMMGDTPETFDFNAIRFALGDTSVTRNIRGKQGGFYINALRGRAAQYYIDRGMPPEKAIQAIAEFEGMKSGARSLSNQEARITGALQGAKAVARPVLDISDRISRTEYPDINAIVIAAKRKTGNQDVIRLGNAVETLVANYASALGRGNSVLTDDARRHASKLLEVGFSKGQMGAAVDQMLIEIDREQQGIQKALGIFIRKEAEPYEPGSILKSGAATPSTTATPAKPDVKQGGHTYRWDAKEGKYKAID